MSPRCGDNFFLCKSLRSAETIELDALQDADPSRGGCVMDAQQFLAEFGHIANAPNGIAKLRELVLVLAMQGRLLSQVASESATLLLETISAEKQSLIASRAIRPPKPLPAVTAKETPHILPDNWAWVRFGEIAVHNSGKTLDSVRNSGHPRDYITTSNLYWGRLELSNVKQMLIRDDELWLLHHRRGDQDTPRHAAGELKRVFSPDIRG